MSLYDVDKLIAETRKLAVQYRQATGKTLPVTGEIAVHDVIRLLNLTPAAQDQNGFDALDINGKRIQIKGRTLLSNSKSSQRIGQIKQDADWDSVMLVLMDEEYQPIEIYEAGRDVILETAKKTSTKRRNRGILSVARFKMLGNCVWQRTTADSVPRS